MTQVPVQSGEAAPDFAVPAVQENRLISLADYRGSTPLLLGLFRGLYCPFCRRALAQMASTSEKLKPLGVESLAVVGTELENARLYFRFRPTRLALGADPQLDDASLIRRAATGADARVGADGRECSHQPDWRAP